MKKITFILLVLLSFSISWNITAQITSYPYQEDFESGDGGWVADNTTNGTWALGTPAGAIINSADSGTNAWVTNLTGNYNSSESSWVTSPVFDLSSLTAPSIELSIWYDIEFSWDGAVMQSSIDSGATWQNVGAFGDGNNWYTDDTIGGNPGGQQEGWSGTGTAGTNAWVVARHALIGLGGQSNVIFRIAFGSDGSVTDEGFGFDSVNIFEVVCSEPTGLTVSGITATTADVSWTSVGSETAWEVVVQAAGTGAPTGSGDPTTANPYTATGLTAVTDYEVYVRADCLTDGYSPWVGPINFLSACDIFIPDYIEDFTTIIPNCWDEADNGDATTGPMDLGAGSWVADEFLNIGAGDGAYKINLYASSKSDWILSPQFDLTGGPFQVDFDFAIMQWNSSTTAGTLGSDDIVELFISTDNGATWISLIMFDNTSVVPASGTQVVYDLTAYSGQIVQFGILGSEGTVDDSADNDIFVDNFRVRTIPSCLEPTGLTVSGITDNSADVSWTSGGTETDWEVVIQPTGTGVPTGSGSPTTTNNPYSFTMLNPSTAYEVYVRANCLTDGYSIWVGPIAFTTLNTPPPPPNGVTCASGSSSFIFTEDFETDPASGWTGTTFTGTDGDWDITVGNANSGGTGPSASFSGGMHLEYEASGNSTVIASAISPAIDLSTAVDGAEMSFYMHSFGADMGTLNVGVGTSVAGPFTNVYTWIGDYQSADTEAWVPIGVNLDAYLGQVIYVEFSYGGAGTGWEGDMSIDFFRVESCGSFCIAPSQVVVSNVTGTTADVTWTANNGESEWEYVVQPVGTGEPTGSGMITNTPLVNLTGLDFSTDYEIYVRANCGSDYSTWAGPVNFSTTIQINYLVDCIAGPITQDYCYMDDIDDDPSVATFTYTSSDGTPLNLTFNSGEVESCCDELVVLDSDGTEMFNDSVGDVSGLTFQSTGDTISFYVNSDFSVSCESGSFPEGINYTVACATCINPTANYIVVDDCDNGDQFLIDVDITSIGDAVSLTISDNMGSTPVQVTETGITQFGPYPFLTDIIITIENDDDVNCIINSSAIQQAACPPDNDNPCDATIAVVNDNESCDLLTPGTIVAASDSGVPVGTCGGDPDDDVWFEFVALNEAQLISLVNIQGSTTNLDHAVYEGVCDNLVELYCSGDAASVTPVLTIGNTYFIRVFSAFSNEETSTFDLCIKEAPDNINCENASNFCSDGAALYGSNVIGIPNSTSVACLGTIPNPSWNTIQIGETGPINIQIEQNTEFDEDGNPIGNGLDVDFVLWGPFDGDTDFCELDLLVDCPTCPNNTSNPDFYPFDIIVDCSYDPADVENVTIENAIEGEIYVLLVTNYSDDPGIIQIQQTNAGDNGAGAITADIEVDLGTDQDLCGFPDYTIVADSPYADTYEWYQNGINMPDEIGDSITVTESDTYTVIVYNDQCDVSAIDEVVINFYQDANANPVEDMVTCDDASADDIEDFDLETQTPIVLGDQMPSDFAVTYHTSLSDAQLAIGALSSPYNNVSNPQTIFIRIEDINAVGSGSGCFVTTSFELIISGPLPTATSVDMALCDDFSRDEIEPFDLDGNSSNILDGQSDTMFTVSYYLTEADAEAGLSSLTSPYENVSNPQTIYARVENNDAFDCYKTTAFDLVVNDVPYTTFEADIVYEVCPNATIPIEVTAIANNYAETDVTINWYQDDVLIPGENSLLLPVLTEGTYTIETTFNTTGCVYEADILVTELETCVIPQAISPNSDGFNDEFDLSSYDVHSLEIYNRNGKLVYSKDNYSHEWVGQTDNGDLLPVGTYFYVMRYQDNKEKTAWIYLNY